MILCLSSGASHIELLEGLEAKDVYLALTRLELRFGTKIIQMFSDSGTQLSPSLLGEKKGVFQQKLEKLWAVSNNTPY